MIHFITLCLFLIIISIATIICSLLKILEQKHIKNKRINILAKNDLFQNNDCMSQSLLELYTKSYSHYTTYCVGHFSSILLDIYSIILSITSLSMITLNISNKLTQSISLLSTFFIITLVFSRLDERSTYHLSAWNRCENIIIEISHLLSNCDDIRTIQDDIYSLIASYRSKNNPKNNHLK